MYVGQMNHRMAGCLGDAAPRGPAMTTRPTAHGPRPSVHGPRSTGPPVPTSISARRGPAGRRIDPSLYPPFPRPAPPPRRTGSRLRAGKGQSCKYIPAYLHTCIPAYLHTCIPAYIHAYIHTYRVLRPPARPATQHPSSCLVRSPCIRVRAPSCPAPRRKLFERGLVPSTTATGATLGSGVCICWAGHASCLWYRASRVYLAAQVPGSGGGGIEVVAVPPMATAAPI